jgi:hypothetical protein
VQEREQEYAIHDTQKDTAQARKGQELKDNHEGAAGQQIFNGTDFHDVSLRLSADRKTCLKCHCPIELGYARPMNHSW